MFLNEFLKNSDKSLEEKSKVTGPIRSQAKVHGRLRPGFKLLAVEPRVMFDGAASATADHAFDTGSISQALMEARYQEKVARMNRR